MPNRLSNSRYVAPTLAIHHKLNRSLGNPEPFCKGLLSYCGGTFQFSNFHNVCIFQFCQWMFNSTSWISSAFALHIRHVFSVSGRKQMGRIAARSIVTVMANLKPGGNFTKSPLPHDAMCQFRVGAFSVCVRALRMFNESTVSVISLVAQPRPANRSFSNFNFFPKPMLWRRS